MTKFLHRLALALALIAPAVARADTGTGTYTYGTMSDYFVGATSKLAITALGPAPTVTTIAAAGAAQTLSFGNYGSNAYDITLTANLTISLNAPTAGAGIRQSIFITVRNPTGGYTLTLPATLKWNNAGTTAPTWTTTAGYTYAIEIWTTDGGTTYFAR
jgi:hypothetical protein